MIHEKYEDFIGGEAEQTNWPQLPETLRRKDKELYLVDVNNQTVGKGTTLKLARKLADLLGGVVRRHVITEEQLVQEASDGREEVDDDGRAGNPLG